MKYAKRIVQEEELRGKILKMLLSEEFGVLVGCVKEFGKRPSPAVAAPEHALVLGALANAEVFGWQNCLEKVEHFDAIIMSMMQNESSAKNEEYDYGAKEILERNDPLRQ